MEFGEEDLFYEYDHEYQSTPLSSLVDMPDQKMEFGKMGKKS